MSRLWEKLLDLLYPPKCVFCRTLVPEGRMLCPACEGNLPRPEGEDGVRYGIPHLALCRFPLYYTGTVFKSGQVTAVSAAPQPGAPADERL